MGVTRELVVVRTRLEEFGTGHDRLEPAGAAKTGRALQRTDPPQAVTTPARETHTKPMRDVTNPDSVCNRRVPFEYPLHELYAHGPPYARRDAALIPKIHRLENMTRSVHGRIDHAVSS